MCKGYWHSLIHRTWARNWQVSRGWPRWTKDLNFCQCHWYVSRVLKYENFIDMYINTKNNRLNYNRTETFHLNCILGSVFILEYNTEDRFQVYSVLLEYCLEYNTEDRFQVYSVRLEYILEYNTVYYKIRFEEEIDKVGTYIILTVNLWMFRC